MSNKEDLYIHVDADSHKIARSNLLESQADLLKIMKHMQNLKFLSRQKLDLKNQLHTLFEMLVGEVNLMEKNLPKPLLPKTIEEKEIIHEQRKVDYSKRDEIDAELRSIKEKLKALNS